MDETPIGRLVSGLAKWVAVLGGVGLAAAALVTVVSVIGRSLIPIGLSPILGDVELVQAAMMFVICSFLPWCHLDRGHAVVAVMMDKFPVRYSAIAEAVWDAFMLLAAAFIAWRFWFGLMDKLGNNESTLLLRIPLWISYAGGALGLFSFVIVALYCLVRSTNNAVAREPAKPVSGGGE